jgi:hypothetical protein
MRRIPRQRPQHGSLPPAAARARGCPVERRPVRRRQSRRASAAARALSRVRQRVRRARRPLRAAPC